MNLKNIVKAGIMVLLIMGLLGCVRVGQLREETRSVELEEAESVEVEIRMGSGDLKLQGGARELMEGLFSYNVSA